MKIKDVKEIEASASGLLVTGKVVAVYDGKQISGNKNGKDYSFVSTSIKLEDDTGSIYVQFIDKDEELHAVKGKEITCISCSVNEYVNKQGVTQRSLRATDFSSEVTVDTAELPKQNVIKEESTQAELETPSKTPETATQPTTWDLKDVKIIRQHCETDATSLVIKYFKGTLEEATAQVIATSNILVSSVYQGLDFPIKDKREELLDKIKKDSDKNIASLPINNGGKQPEKKFVMEPTSMERKILDLKNELHDDIKFRNTLEDNFGAGVDFDDLDDEKQAEFATMLSKMIIEKGKELI